MINEALVLSNCLFRFLDFWFANGNNFMKIMKG